MYRVCPLLAACGASTVDEPLGREVECPLLACVERVDVPLAEIASCYGWDAESGWSSDAPDEVADACDGRDALCEVVTAEGAGFVADTACGCLVGGAGEEVSPECCRAPEDASQPALFLQARLLADCGVSLAIEVSCEPAPAPTLGQLCQDLP